MSKKQTILNTIEDLCSDFLYYDRKNDEDLSFDDIRNAVKGGEITIEEMVEYFRKHLLDTIQ